MTGPGTTIVENLMVTGDNAIINAAPFVVDKRGTVASVVWYALDYDTPPTSNVPSVHLLVRNMDKGVYNELPLLKYWHDGVNPTLPWTPYTYSIGGPTIGPDGTIYLGINYFNQNDLEAPSYTYHYSNGLLAVDPDLSAMRMKHRTNAPTMKGSDYIKWGYPDHTMWELGTDTGTNYQEESLAPYPSAYRDVNGNIRLPAGEVWVAPLILKKNGFIYYAHNAYVGIASFLPFYGGLPYVVAVSPMGYPMKMTAVNGGSSLAFTGSPIEVPGSRIAVPASDGKLRIYNADLTISKEIDLTSGLTSANGIYYLSTPILTPPDGTHPDGIIYVAMAIITSMGTNYSAPYTAKEYLFAVDASLYEVLFNGTTTPLLVGEVQGLDIMPNLLPIEFGDGIARYYFILPQPLLSGTDVYLATIDGSLHQINFMTSPSDPIIQSVLPPEFGGGTPPLRNYNTANLAMGGDGILYWSTMLEYEASEYKWRLVRLDSTLSQMDSIDLVPKLSTASTYVKPVTTLASPVIGPNNELYIGSGLINNGTDALDYYELLQLK
jgi:hypothetical protein